MAVETVDVVIVGAGPAGSSAARELERLGVACVLLDRATLVVGNDSGLIHIAAACGTPVIGLYGPQLPERFGPGSARSIALHHRVDCCPCAQRICVRPEDPCVNLITLEEVVSAAERLLEASVPDAGRGPGRAAP